MLRLPEELRTQWRLHPARSWIVLVSAKLQFSVLGYNSIDIIAAAEGWSGQSHFGYGWGKVLTIAQTGQKRGFRVQL